MNKYLKYGIMGVTAVALSALLFTPREQETEILPASRDYAEIVRSGVLRAITEYNSVSFHCITRPCIIKPDIIFKIFC